MHASACFESYYCTRETILYVDILPIIIFYDTVFIAAFLAAALFGKPSPIMAWHRAITSCSY